MTRRRKLTPAEIEARVEAAKTAGKMPTWPPQPEWYDGVISIAAGPDGRFSVEDLAKMGPSREDEKP